MQVVKKRDFVRSQVDYNTNFVVTNDGVLEGVWIPVKALKEVPVEDRIEHIVKILEELEIVGINVH